MRYLSASHYRRHGPLEKYTQDPPQIRWTHMLTEFDQSTIANMTAALEYVCKKIPADKDTHELRKQIANEIIACARKGRRTLVDFQDAGLTIVEELTRPAQSWWQRWRTR